MSSLVKIKKCSHCGSFLQTSDQNKDGYISSDILEKYPEGVLLCNKCYDENRHSINEIILGEEFKAALKNINFKNKLIIYVIDLFSFEGGFSAELNKKIKNCDVIVVGNKLDLMPKNINEKELIDYLTHRLNLAGLKAKEILLMSSNNGYNLDRLKEIILNEYQNKDVFFVGSQNSGKTSLIESLLKTYKNKTNQMIITYNYPNTNLKGFRIPINDKNYIYDFPGILIENNFLSISDKYIKNLIEPKSSLVEDKFLIANNIGCSINGLAFLELVKGEKTKLRCFFSEKISINGKLLEPIKYFKNELKLFKNKHPSYKYDNLTKFDAYELTVEDEGERSIGILGLGWFQFIGKNQVFRIYVPEGIFVYTTRAKLINVRQQKTKK